jgi:hypothetical protein
VKTGKYALIAVVIVFALLLSACPPIDEEDDDDIVTLSFEGQLDKNAWTTIVIAVSNQKGKVNLDLKGCTYVEKNDSGGLIKVVVDDGSYPDPQDPPDPADKVPPEYIAFDPVPGVDWGQEKIVSIILPDDAQMVNQAVMDEDVGTITEKEAKENTAFQDFTNLRSVSGANVVLIGNYAFAGCTSLREVDFPRIGHKVTDDELQNIDNEMIDGYRADIGHYAFKDCTALAEVTFNAAAVIGKSSFKGCTSLTKISFPQVWSIGDNAFEDCQNLTVVRFESATKIGKEAFKNCAMIEAAYFDANPDPGADPTGSIDYDSVIFGKSAFSGCKALEKLDVRNAWNVFFDEGVLENSGSEIEIYLYDDDSESPDQTCWGHPQTEMLLGEGSTIFLRKVTLIVPKSATHVDDDDAVTDDNIAHYINENYTPRVVVSLEKRHM